MKVPEHEIPCREERCTHRARRASRSEIVAALQRQYRPLATAEVAQLVLAERGCAWTVTSGAAHIRLVYDRLRELVIFDEAVTARGPDEQHRVFGRPAGDRLRRYWALPHHATPPDDAADRIAELNRILEEAGLLVLVSSPPDPGANIAITGGLDALAALVTLATEARPTKHDQHGSDTVG